MQDVINTLKTEAKALNFCLNDPEWACTGSEDHKECRREYRARLRNINKAIKILNEHI